jgi:hypothetical protein
VVIEREPASANAMPATSNVIARAAGAKNDFMTILLFNATPTSAPGGENVPKSFLQCCSQEPEYYIL